MKKKSRTPFQGVKCKDFFFQKKFLEEKKKGKEIREGTLPIVPWQLLTHFCQLINLY
jgi:hypothetical protein